MAPGSLRGKNREIALGTLVELLVQIVFIFTLVLLVSEAIEGAPGDRGWIAPDSWRTLISVFDIDPHKVRGINEQTEEIKKRYLEGKAEAAKARNALLKAEDELRRLQKKQGRGGPGNPVCRDSNGNEQVVLEAVVNASGDIAVRVTPSAAGLSSTFLLPPDAGSGVMTPVQFRQALKPWRQQGLSRTPPCAYKAFVKYDASAPAGLYERARLAVFSYFHMAAPPKSQ